jgi:nitroimidazol reductase NimA-like FMN-containing flavoprotein (pyridoxamine 5'-phosphate oxidase superfamily)/GNAT superfamily N-acetyltransferase
MSEPFDLSALQCKDLLGTTVVGRIAFSTPKGPQILPVNYSVVDRSIVIRTSPYGVLATQAREQRAAFEVDHFDHEYQHGWSVVAHGRLVEVIEPDEIARIRAVRQPRPWAGGPSRNLHLQLTWTELTGRRLGLGWDLFGRATNTPKPADVVLADGTVAAIRPLAPEDLVEIEALHDDVSDDSFLMRFFTLGRKAGHDYSEHLVNTTDGPAVALVATVHHQIVAIASAETITADTAEISFLVADGHRGHGLGTLLLEHLAAFGRDHGIRMFVAEVLLANRAMLEVFADAGFVVTRTIDGNIARVELLTRLPGEQSSHRVTSAPARTGA